METPKAQTSKVVITIITVLMSGIIGMIWVRPVMGSTIVERSQIPLDEYLSDQEQNQYRPIETVAVTRITAPDAILFGDSDAWMKGLYYYMITKYGFVDIPFNYIVTWQGTVYEGKAGGAHVSPIIREDAEHSLDDSMVLVAYFDNNQGVTNVGKDAMTTLVSQLLSRNRLGRTDVKAVDVGRAKTEGDVYLGSLLVTETASSLWQSYIAGIANNSSISITDGDEVDRGSIEKIEYMETVQAGQHFVVTAEIKNEGTVPWYNSGNQNVIVATSSPRNHDSQFYYPDTWASFTRVVVSEEGWILPGETGTYRFEMQCPLIPGTYNESFELLMMPDRWIDGTSFEVSFTVSRGDFQLVEIRDTETGYLNVRDCPSTSCAEVGKVVPGDVLILRDEDGSWLKVEIADGKAGWVYARYAKKL